VNPFTQRDPSRAPGSNLQGLAQTATQPRSNSSSPPRRDVTAAHPWSNSEHFRCCPRTCRPLRDTLDGGEPTVQPWPSLAQSGGSTPPCLTCDDAISSRCSAARRLRGRSRRGRSKAPGPVIGFMSGRSPAESAGAVAALRRGVAEGGYVEGRNVAIEYRWANGHYDRLPSLAAELVGRAVAVLAATGGSVSGLAAKAATTTIPIVFSSGGDAIKLGLVPSLNPPGAHVTGVNLVFGAPGPKRPRAPAARCPTPHPTRTA